MAGHLSSVLEHIGNFTKNSLTCSSGKNKDKDKEKEKDKVKDAKQGNGALVPVQALPPPAGTVPGSAVQQLPPPAVTTTTTTAVVTTGTGHAHGQRALSVCPVAPLKRPLKLKNVSSTAENFDSLYFNCDAAPLCTETTCLGSVMGIPGRGDVPREAPEVLRQAKEFLDQYYGSIRRVSTSAHEARWQAVQADVAATGTYQLTETELVYGAKLAWRNAPRCIGRIQWSKLQVFDCRLVTTTSGMFEALCNHMKYSTNKGNIRSAITIFPQRTDINHDYRIWNSQMLSYAGYKNPDGTITGDPMHVEFTELCMRLGWKAPRTSWDILPLVLSANGKDPDFFEIPKDLIMEIEFTHPTYEWFKDLKLRWYALPAVANMRFDCGGIEFTANAFNGWYMATEIGCRNLCDVNRLNMIEPIANRMGLDTRTPVSLWKDRALVEANVAVLHSFQQRNVTIVDHHTASDSFMKHLDNESRLRSGCPSDWIWIVPPMSASITPVFHQEMALYYLKPSYDYQDAAWKTHRWQKGRDGDRSSITSKKPRRKFHFKQIARAVKFTSKLFGRALSRRIKATVLYATETGKSEHYAKKLGIIFGHAFNAQVHCMSDYDISSIEHEALLLVVTSTFGNGDPPENGESFAKDLHAMKNWKSDEGMSGSMQTPKSFMKMNSQTDLPPSDGLSRAESLRRSQGDSAAAGEEFGPLSNVRFAVFALGSSAYPNFCAFGGYVDTLLEELGGERIMKMEHGDEMCGQDQAFRKWAGEVFGVACETFCLDNDNSLKNVTDALGTVTLSEDTVRFQPDEGPEKTLLSTLQSSTSKKLFPCPVTSVRNLHGESQSRATIFVELETNDPEIAYQPGDHVGILPCNRKELVDEILERVRGVEEMDKPMQLETLKENHTSNGVEKTWEAHERLPVCTLRQLFTRFVDITTPPTANLLNYLATCCGDEDDKVKLETLATDATAYEDWRHYGAPTLSQTLRQFKSARPHAALLAAQLVPLQPRFYSISSSPLAHPNQVHLTVAIVSYHTQDGTTHHGVCSTYLNDRKPGDEVYMFIRSAPSFHLPAEQSRPIILVGPGTGIAPFRGFWHHRRHQAKQNPKEPLGDAWLFFGCRTKQMDLYRDEKEVMANEGTLSRVFLALSREEGVPKTYVQGLAEQEGAQIYSMLAELHGHFYVCGDCTMAEHVYQTLKGIIKKHGGLSDQEVESFMLMIKDENRYHEDIFGITLRTAEIQNKSRESARIKMATQP